MKKIVIYIDDKKEKNFKKKKKRPNRLSNIGNSMLGW